jgi:bifunctional non-homologous end joining protein LigD
MAKDMHGKKRSPLPLEEYQSKRDFSITPEPAGETKPRRRPGPARKPIFCVHKHLASRLHYDFRLEHGGLLLSWAVPKGPSIDPKEKRLAVRTEDHPLAYAEFEGVIPEGYGAGIVSLWDSGTWKPLPGSANVAAALERGELKLDLDGSKLKGAWTLVRRGRGERDWLLIKKRDAWGGPVDILKFAPLSVKSGKDLAGILAGEDLDIWRSNRPARGGATGRLLEEVIRQAAEIKAGTSRR